MDPIIEYAENHSTPENLLLQKVNRETHLFVMHPRMLSGHLQGVFLKMISCMIRPTRILEIGTYTGYSAICLCEGLKDGGELITLEHNPELEDRALGYFREAGLSEKIQMKIGDALDLIPGLEGLFDLVFIDADKRSYPEFYELAMEKTRPGGFILADNALWSGKVVKEAATSDMDTRGLQDFNRRVKKDERTENLLLPFHDGVMMIRKK